MTRGMKCLPPTGINLGIYKFSILRQPPETQTGDVLFAITASVGQSTTQEALLNILRYVPKSSLWINYYDNDNDHFRTNTSLRLGHATFSIPCQKWYFLAFINKMYRRYISKFSYVWSIDSDMQIPTPYNVHYIIQMARIYRIIITSPSLPYSDHVIMHPSRVCQVQATNFIELQAPLMRSDAFMAIYSSLTNSRHKTDWGLDEIWCGFIKARLAIPEHDIPCAVVGAHFLHPKRTGGNYNVTRARWEQLCTTRLWSMYSALNHHAFLGCLKYKRTYGQYTNSPPRTMRLNKIHMNNRYPSVSRKHLPYIINVK